MSSSLFSSPQNHRSPQGVASPQIPNNPAALFQQFQQFKQSMQGQDPQKLIEQAINNGVVTREQVNGYIQQAQSVLSMLSR